MRVQDQVLMPIGCFYTASGVGKNEWVPVDTRRKLNVHKTFRRHPGRLLNVLCTFNLRPVSTGVLVCKIVNH